MARVWIWMLGALCAFLPCVANCETEDPETIYRQAELGEWYGRADLPDIDAMYARAAKAGSPYAFMADMRNRIAAANPEKQNRLAEQLCPRAREIMEKWQKAEKPDSEARFYMARYYAEGICTNRDMKKAREELRASAGADNAKAQYFLAKSLQKKDAEAAFRLFAKAAKTGFVQAIAWEGSCYLLGNGVAKDEQKGKELIEKVLESGNSNALYTVAIWYLDGENGIEKDVPKARAILEDLVARGYKTAEAPLAEITEEEKNRK